MKRPPIQWDVALTWATALVYVALFWIALGYGALKWMEYVQ